MFTFAYQKAKIFVWEDPHCKKGLQYMNLPAKCAAVAQ
jgi:hypothetical protein